MAKKLSAFDQAFADARANGEKTFSFNGKTYGTTTMDDVQKKIDAMPSMSRTTGAPVTTQGATYPKTPAADSGPSDMVKGFRAAREKFGDTPFVDALMNAGKAGIAMESGKLLGPAGRAASAAAKKVFSEDGLFPTFSREQEPPLSTFETLTPENQAVSQQYRSAYDDRPGPMKKGGAVKKHAKGGKINLDACGVSTHKPAKKNANW